MPSEPVAGDPTQRDRRRPTACLMQLQVAKESLCFAGCCPPGAVVELLLAAGEQCLTDETLAAAEERHGPHSVVLNQHATHLLKIMHATLKYRVSHFSEMKGRWREIPLRIGCNVSGRMLAQFESLLRLSKIAAPREILYEFCPSSCCPERLFMPPLALSTLSCSTLSCSLPVASV